MIPNSVLVCGENTNAKKKVSTIQDSSTDLLDQLDCIKWELLSINLRDMLLNLEADNKSKYQRLVTLDNKMTDQMISALCPVPSRYQLVNDVLVMVTKTNG